MVPFVRGRFKEFDTMKYADLDGSGFVKQLGKNEYHVTTQNGALIRCTRKGLQLIDFYRTSDVLAKDVQPNAKESNPEPPSVTPLTR